MSKNPNTTDSDDRDWADLARHARTEGWWEWLIIAALIFEAVLLWVFGCGKSMAEKILNTIANLAIAAGVYGALLSGRKASTTGERLQRRSTERVAEANQKAAEAEARASEANQKAEEARLELEKFRASRKLTSEQAAGLSANLVSFSGTPFIVGVNSFEPEQLRLVQSIETALTEARWQQVDCPEPYSTPRKGKPSMGLRANATNVEINVVVPALPQGLLDNLSIPPPLANAGGALSAALNVAGIEATFNEIPKVLMGMVNPAINVMIGRKE